MSNIPKLRFPEFKGEWEEKRFSDERVRKFCKGTGDLGGNNGKRTDYLQYR